MFQHVLLVPSLSVLENLMLGSSALAASSIAPPALARFRELSAHAGRDDRSRRARSASLSLGQQQQVEIMRALWRDEGVLILDEPTSMLTPGRACRIWDR